MSELVNGDKVKVFFVKVFFGKLDVFFFDEFINGFDI